MSDENVIDDAPELPDDASPEVRAAEESRLLRESDAKAASAPKTADEAVARAFAEAGFDDDDDLEIGESKGPAPEKKTPEPDAKPEDKPEDKPAPKEDAPASLKIKAEEWEKAPEAVREGVKKAVAELENRVKEYDEEFGDLRPWQDLAKKNGTSLRSAIENYAQFEAAFRTDAKAGFQMVADFLGRPVKELAEEVLGREAAPDQAGREIVALRQEIARLKQGMEGVHNNFREQTRAQIMQYVDQFAKEHPHFSEEQEKIAEFVERGYNLDDAYTTAMALRAMREAEARKDKPAEKSPVRGLSVAGSPASGGTPARSGKVPSIEEALRNAGL